MRREANHGAVLLFVLALVAVLAALAVQTVRTSQLEVFSAYAAIYARQAEAMAESGLLAAAALVAEADANPASVSLGDDWAAFPDLPAYPGRWFLDGHIAGRIEDESGKFPVNSLHPGLPEHAVFGEIFLRLLTASPFSLSGDQARVLLAALSDWLDPDDAPSPGGAEDAAYAAAGLAYKVKNNSLDTLAELLLVRGFSRPLLYGQDGRPGLFSLLTVWGAGLINVNTAPLPVLAALPAGVDAARAQVLAAALDAYRRDPVRRESLATPDWLRAAVTDQGVAWPQGALTTRSQFFSVLLEGRSGAATRRLHAVLRRGAAQQSGGKAVCEVLYRELR